VAKPDFTGTWIFNPARSALQIPAPDHSVFVINHRGSRFHLSRTHTVGGTSDTFEIDLTIDGTQTIVDRGDIRISGRARWDGSTLVFESMLSRGTESGSNVVHYVLSKDRATIVAHEQFRSASINYDNVWALERSRLN
jgi:hypothetical protein